MTDPNRDPLRRFLATPVDETNPYWCEFRNRWREGDTAINLIKRVVGKRDPVRLTVGGVSGLYEIREVFENGPAVGIHGYRKPDISTEQSEPPSVTPR